jgi:hypothetical protein
MKKTLFPILILVSASLFGQQKFVSIFQVSLTPGLSTNGLHPGGFRNFFSLNLTSGYSSANYLLEVGVVSNLNEHETRGLQFAGIANLTGANTFAGLQFKEIEKLKREGFEANLSGLQFSGVTNFVMSNLFGGQICGGVNVARGAMQGCQIAGVSNIIRKYSFGFQLAGLWNVSFESMDGVQMSGLANFTNGELYGAQVSLFNSAGVIEGINSFTKKYPTGLQLGLVNYSRTMNGYQVGLVNIGRKMQGTQVGLINIFTNGKTPETRDGTSIGLVNIGSSGYAAMYSNEIFYRNVEFSTGTVKNRRRNTDAKEKQIQNGLIYGSGGGLLSNQKRWAFGYSLKKFFFNRSITPGHGHFNFFSAGLDLLHINHRAQKFTREVSVLARPNVSVGSRIHPRNRNFFFFGTIAYNFYKSKSGEIVGFAEKNQADKNYGWQRWPGLAIGVLIQ